MVLRGNLRFKKNTRMMQLYLDKDNMVIIDFGVKIMNLR